jgi:dTDP-4-amino-4,6-dideoxygalactose transaminase
MIPHSKPWITSADLEAVTTVLESDMIARGTQVADLKRPSRYMSDLSGALRYPEGRQL